MKLNTKTLKRTAAVAVSSIVLLAMSECDATKPGSPGYNTVIPKENQEAAAKLMLALVEKANPMSDEEPEDNIRQAQRTVESLYGKSVLGLWRHYRFTGYDDLTPEQKARCDRWASK